MRYIFQKREKLRILDAVSIARVYGGDKCVCICDGSATIFADTVYKCMGFCSSLDKTMDFCRVPKKRRSDRDPVMYFALPSTKTLLG